MVHVISEKWSIWWLACVFQADCSSYLFLPFISSSYVNSWRIYLCCLEISAAHNVRLFSYNELRSATRNFHPTNKIGGGGFGVVYKVRTTKWIFSSSTIILLTLCFASDHLSKPLYHINTCIYALSCLTNLRICPKVYDENPSNH